MTLRCELVVVASAARFFKSIKRSSNHPSIQEEVLSRVEGAGLCYPKAKVSLPVLLFVNNMYLEYRTT